MVRTYSDGKVGYTLKEVARLMYLKSHEVLWLVGAGELEYFQQRLNSPQYVTKESLDRYVREHVDDIIQRKLKKTKF